MAKNPARPERTELAPGLEISRIVTGLWQVADMEKDGATLDRDAGAGAMADYAVAGFDAFDMADHYGSAELIAGRFLADVRTGGIATPTRPAVFTKWCPTPGPMTRDVVRAGIGRALDRLGVDRIDLMQLHWWSFEHPGYVDALAEMARMRDDGLIGAIGLTNFDTDHLRLVVKHGIPIVSNQVCFSLLDRRAGDDMTAFCLENVVGLLTYGTLAGGTRRFVACSKA